MPELNTLGFEYDDGGHKIKVEPPVSGAEESGWEVTIKSGAPLDPEYNGGPLNITSADGATDGSAGPIIITGGQGFGTGSGGNVTLVGGGGGAQGGHVTFLPGSGDSPGNIRLIPGSGMILLIGIPTSDPAVANALWNDGGALKISAG